MRRSWSSRSKLLKAEALEVYFGILPVYREDDDSPWEIYNRKNIHPYMNSSHLKYCGIIYEVVDRCIGSRVCFVIFRRSLLFPNGSNPAKSIVFSVTERGFRGMKTKCKAVRLASKDDAIGAYTALMVSGGLGYEHGGAEKITSALGGDVGTS